MYPLTYLRWPFFHKLHYANRKPTHSFFYATLFWKKVEMYSSLISATQPARTLYVVTAKSDYDGLIYDAIPLLYLRV